MTSRFNELQKTDSGVLHKPSEDSCTFHKTKQKKHSFLLDTINLFIKIYLCIYCAVWTTMFARFMWQNCPRMWNRWFSTDQYAQIQWRCITAVYKGSNHESSSASMTWAQSSEHSTTHKAFNGVPKLNKCTNIDYKNTL